MRSFISVAAVLALLPQALALTINTPTNVVVCQPILLSWSDGTAPYFVSIIPGGQASAAALKSFDKTDATSVTWNVDIAAGTSITLSVKDSTGAQQYSDQVSIQSGSDTSCVNSSVSVTGTDSATAGTPATTNGSGSTTGSGSANTSGSNSSTKPTSSNASSAASPSASGNGNSASPLSINSLGVAGLVGFVGAALF